MIFTRLRVTMVRNVRNSETVPFASAILTFTSRIRQIDLTLELSGWYCSKEMHSVATWNLSQRFKQDGTYLEKNVKNDE